MKEAEKQLQELPSQEIDVTRITREVHLNEEMFTLLTKRLEDARILEAARTAPITLIDAAIEPSVPESPNKRYNLFVGTVAGLLLGLVVVLVRQHFDTSITPEEIQSYLQLPVLATIPHIERRHRNVPREGLNVREPDPMGEARSRLLAHFSPQSLHVEVHHMLRNNLMKNFSQNESLVFLFTSSVTGEGKSIAAANFAIAAAQVGVRTLLVDVDLRKPMQHQLFHVRQEPGITNYFYSTPRWETCLMPWDQIHKESPELQTAINVGGLGNLTLMTAGKQPTNPVPFLGSDRFKQLIVAMRQRYPLIILDGAPALMFADCSILSAHATGVILLYRYGRTPREILRRTHTQLVNAGAKVLGVVANDIAQGGIALSDNYYRLYENYEKPYSSTPPAATT
jgi:tyrosine-protein kinase Etk/Wzc